MSDTTEVIGTHGDVATHRGTCWTCGRENVWLKVNIGRRTGEPHYTCVDQFACFDAWRARR